MQRGDFVLNFVEDDIGQSIDWLVAHSEHSAIVVRREQWARHINNLLLVCGWGAHELGLALGF